MTRVTSRTTTGAAVLLALALAATGCSTKAKTTDTGGGTAAGGVKTGPGVTASTITLGVLTDESGVFASLGKTVSQGNQLGVDELNAGGKICGRTVELDVKATATTSRGPCRSTPPRPPRWPASCSCSARP